MSECNKVVRVQYLGDFINGLTLKDRDGNSRNVSGEPTYCPTYSGLTSGTHLGSRSASESPHLDDDGVIVGDSYSGNQLVIQKDLSIGYTVFSSFTISTTANSIPSSGGSLIFSSEVKFIRYTKSMNSSCSAETTSYTVTDTAITVTYSPPSVGSFSSNELTVPENDTGADRTIKVTATISFRGETKTSNEIQLTQGNNCGCGKVTLTL